MIAAVRWCIRYHYQLVAPTFSSHQSPCSVLCAHPPLQLVHRQRHNVTSAITTEPASPSSVSLSPHKHKHKPAHHRFHSIFPLCYTQGTVRLQTSPDIRLFFHQRVKQEAVRPGLLGSPGLHTTGAESKLHSPVSNLEPYKYGQQRGFAAARGAR